MVELPQLQGLNDRLIAHTSDGRRAYLLIGRRGNYIKLSPSAYHLLRNINAGVSFEALAERMSKQQGRAVAVTEVEAAYHHVVAHLTAIESKTDRLPFGFWLRLRVVPAHVVQRIAHYLAFAFHPMAALCLLGSLSAVLLWSLGDLLRPDFFALGDSYMASFWVVYALYLISLAAHELGHSSACVRFGVRPRDIGFALYWIYPVFYSDVNAAWQLKRRQRVVVDLGGIFFQMIIGAVYLVLYKIYGWETGRLAFLLITFSAIFALNPFFRFDGYWVVADALGVMNLWQQVRRMLRSFYHRLRGLPAEPLPWPLGITALMSAYTLTSMTFLGYFIWRIVPLIADVVVMYPALIAGLIRDLANPPHQLATGRLESIFSPTFLVIAVALMLFKLCNWTRRALQPFVRQLIHSRRGLGMVEAKVSE
jgi:putative peptide zinc metalloprotease protein